MTILVIEDEPLLLSAIEKKLSLHDITVVDYSLGADALDYLSKAQPLPDAIWLDYALPDMNGVDFMKEVRENAAWSNIPVIVVSNSASDEKVSAMKALGISHYILKAEHTLEEIITMFLAAVGKK